MEPHHAYMLLFDDGKLSDYLGDGQRTEFLEKASDREPSCESTII